MNTKEIKAAIRELKREMKAKGIRKVSCFNGGLSRDESYYNTELFRLNTQLQQASK